jgi:hypothetical protein
MLAASSCVFLRSSKPQQATVLRGGGIAASIGSSRLLTVSCNASSSPAPPPQDDSECNDVECAPEKEVPTNRLALAPLLFLFFFLAVTDCAWLGRSEA